MVAPGAGLIIAEGQSLRIGIDHLDRFNQALGVPVKAYETLFILTRIEAFQRLLEALTGMDGLSLCPAFINA